MCFRILDHLAPIHTVGVSLCRASDETLEVLVKAATPDADLSLYLDAIREVFTRAIALLESVVSSLNGGAEIERQDAFGEVGVRG